MLPKHYIFNHFAKTGGTSLLAVCRHNLDPSEISPHLDYTELHLMPVARFEHYRLINGHFSLLAQTRFCRSRYSMTILRDPIRRIFSAYTFWRIEPDDPVTIKAKELSFSDFVLYFADSPAIIRNPYTHHFAIVDRDCGAYPCDDSALLAAAKRNLAAFDYVGICEEFGRSMRLLCAELGWRPLDAVPRENSSGSGDRFGGINPRTLEILRDRNRLDLELYEYAVQLFHAREAGTARHAGCPEKAPPHDLVPLPLPQNPGRRVAIESVSAQWMGDESSRMLEIAVRFKPRVPIAELCLGVQITNATGDIVWGTNTANACLELDYEPGRDCRGAFLVECQLPQGTYFVGAALSEPRLLGFHDHWIDRAESFTVAPPRVASSRYSRGVWLREFSSVVIGDIHRVGWPVRGISAASPLPNGDDLLASPIQQVGAGRGR